MRAPCGCRREGARTGSCTCRAAIRGRSFLSVIVGRRGGCTSIDVAERSGVFDSWLAQSAHLCMKGRTVPKLSPKLSPTRAAERPEERNRTGARYGPSVNPKAFAMNFAAGARVRIAFGWYVPSPNPSTTPFAQM